MKNTIKVLFVMIFLTVFACGSEDTGRLTVRLTDSPGDYDAVNIDLKSVEINAETENETSGWTKVKTNARSYNLLDLTNGAETLIVDEEIPSGNIGQIRLVLGTNNTVVIDGESFELTTPSAQQSGLKVKINQTLLEGVTYSILLDFDAAKSVVKTGSNKYILKPVITAVTEAQNGAIEGIVIPEELNVAIYAIVGEDTIKTSYAIDGSQEFLVGGLPSNTYKLGLDPGELSGYQSQVIENIEVVTGEVKDIGSIELIQN